MSPNKRAANKKQLAIWLDVDVYNRFSRAADAFGLTMTSILTAYITEKVDEYEATVKRRTARRASETDSTSSEGRRQDR
jgi:hypothetical protein